MNSAEKSHQSESGSGKIRARFEHALAGDPVEQPIYAVYDWFVRNRPIDWASLFDLGLGQINHANLVRHERPHLEIVEEHSEVEGRTRRDVRWITDRGELHEWYLDEWRQEFLVKRPEDYRVLHRALEDSRVVASGDAFNESEQDLGQRGITVGQLGRTPLMEVQIDLAGLERFALDIAEQRSELMELLELMTELKLAEFRAAAQAPARYIKLWENLSIETIGLRRYREVLVPLYHQIFEILDTAGQRLLVHYDGKLRLIADDIAELDIDGIDSFTPPPEGDMSVAEGRKRWPKKFLWLHPPLGWYREPDHTFVDRIKQMIADAGGQRFCLMISEDVPPDWQRKVPLLLEVLEEEDTTRRL